MPVLPSFRRPRPPAQVHLLEPVRPSQVECLRVEVRRSLWAGRALWAAPRPQWCSPQARQFPAGAVKVRPSRMQLRTSDRAGAVRPAVDKVAVYPVAR
ncbi:MAG: hypothetical protein ACSLE7_08770 [Mycobacterium sp.]